MAKKRDFKFRGKTLEEVRALSLNDFAELANARVRRTIKRGFTDAQKRLLAKIKASKEGKWKKPIKTHCRDMVILPRMIGMTIHIYTGKQFVPLQVGFDMLGGYLGEYALSRGRVQHSAPGVGATKSSAAAKK